MPARSGRCGGSDMPSKPPDRSSGPASARRTSLAWRITLLVVSVAIAVALIAGVVGAAMIRNTAQDVTRNYLSNQADVIEDQITGADPGYRIGLVKLAQVFARQGISVVSVGRGGHLSGPDAAAVTLAGSAGVAGLTDGASMSKTLSVDGHTELLEARGAGDRSFALIASADI